MSNKEVVNVEETLKVTRSLEDYMNHMDFAQNNKTTGTTSAEFQKYKMQQDKLENMSKKMEKSMLLFSRAIQKFAKDFKSIDKN